MLEEYLTRKDVKSFMSELKKNECFYQKKHRFENHSLPISSELALFIFYDALLKFKIIIDDVEYLKDFLDQLDRLYRKMDSFEEVRFGIHKVLAKTASIKFDIPDWRGEGREEFITELYDRYIVNGYIYHGFPYGFSADIERNGLVPEYYDNYYERFDKVKAIFKKHHVPMIMHKDFETRCVCYTDDALFGCYYAMYAPMFFFELLTNPIFGRKRRVEDYVTENYEGLLLPIKKYMSNNFFSEKEKKFILDVIQDEWNLLQRGQRDLCLLAVPRSKVLGRQITLEEFLKDSSDIIDVVDRMLSSKYNNLSSYKIISRSDLEIIRLPHYYQKKKEMDAVLDLEKEYYRTKENEVGKEFLNAYGNVSILILSGALLISLGVILTIIKMLGG